ncbi:hypothetical protein LSH36_625g01032 [Paralvinella palmiformis]|uniref:Uncharacterized protein n=1 Tax=Paralvinella palmiformis TaxID=53620 RepID=A0AAD9MW13_9ANNE|nr:hypothetical protein LSH36_625g01032 [Paralvinella palmiformis]
MGIVREENRLKYKLKLEQTRSSNLYKEVGQLHVKLIEHQQTVHDQLVNEQHPEVQTPKDNSEKFTDGVKKTTIALLPRCRIQTVAKYLFSVDISSLASERTVRRYADQGHVLANAVTANTVDIHSDGTTHDKKKYIGYQVTTSEGSLSCGFTTVAPENSSTLKKGNCNVAVQATLGTDESFESLGCNTHFLLGLSTKTNTALIAIQKRHNESRIGRDLEPQFSSFSIPEAAAVRYVRMACEVLGPCGDEKAGC